MGISALRKVRENTVGEKYEERLWKKRGKALDKGK